MRTEVEGPEPKSESFQLTLDTYKETKSANYTHYVFMKPYNVNNLLKILERGIPRHYYPCMTPQLVVHNKNGHSQSWNISKVVFVDFYIYFTIKQELFTRTHTRTHARLTLHWVEAGWSRLTIALWGHTLDQHHTGLRQVEVGWQ